MPAHHIERDRPRCPAHDPQLRTARRRGRRRRRSRMSQFPSPREDSAERYEIRVRGHLASHWAAWFGGMTLSRQDDGTTVISGTVADQSALHGLLRKLNDLGLALVSVTPT